MGSRVACFTLVIANHTFNPFMMVTIEREKHITYHGWTRVKGGRGHHMREIVPDSCLYGHSKADRSRKLPPIKIDTKLSLVDRLGSLSSS